MSSQQIGAILALIKCSDCGKDISNRASQCVGCGAPVDSNADSGARSIALNDSDTRRARGGVRRTTVLLAALAVIALAWWAPFDAGAERTVDAGLKRAFVTYATARTLNGVISVAQGTEVTLGVGASTTLSVGEILDPINDAVEQFSDLMLLATISFGMQKMLLMIGGHWSINASLTIVILVAMGLSLSRRSIPDLVRGVLVLLLLARFAVPLASAGSEMVYRVFLQQPYAESSQAIGTVTDEISAMQGRVAAESEADAEAAAQSEQPSDEKPGLLQRFWNGAKTVASALNPFNAFGSMRTKMADLKQRAEQLAENLVRLAVVFLLQTLVFPLLFLWGFYYLVRSAIGPRAAQDLPPPNRWPDNLKHVVGSRRKDGAADTKQAY